MITRAKKNRMVHIVTNDSFLSHSTLRTKTGSNVTLSSSPCQPPTQKLIALWKSILNLPSLQSFTGLSGAVGFKMSVLSN